MQRGEPGEKVSMVELMWSYLLRREVFWQTGTSERSSHEFSFAEDFPQRRLWRQIAEASLNGVFCR